MPTKQELLESVPLFAQLPKSTLERLDRIAVEREFPAGAEIVREGELGVAFFLVVSGKVELTRGTNNTPLATVGPGQFFGEMALLDGSPRSASAHAVEPTKCLLLTRWDFVSELRQNSDLAIRLLEVLSGWLRARESSTPA